jgi:hypothetical protein
MRRIAVTLTTINKPVLLEAFIALIGKHGTGEARVDFIVVGDQKTPSGVDRYIDGLNGRSPSRFIYLGLEQQERMFGGLTRLWQHIPVNSFSRRNYGDLFAYNEGYDTVIRIDDDNFPTDTDFFGAHAVVGTSPEAMIVKSANGWYNVCETLSDRDGVPFYPRGYPYPRRWEKTDVRGISGRRRVVVNAGLWIGDPDVDAMTRLCKPIDVIGFDATKWGSTFLLDRGTWCPINTQNTAFHRDTIPAAFISPFAGRYDDILSGFFLRRIVDELGDAVAFGAPLLNQIRNAHDLWRDLEKELPGAKTSPELTERLREIQLSGTSYTECFAQLAQAVRRDVALAQEFYAPIFDGMEIWADLFR